MAMARTLPDDPIDAVSHNGDSGPWRRYRVAPMNDAAASDSPTPPLAERRAHTRTVHGTTVEDPWFWLRDRDDPATIAYLRAENDHADRLLAPLAPLAETIFEEIKGRINQTDMSVPVRKGPWWYLSRTREGAQYGIHVRQADAAGAPDGVDQLLFDENVAAGESDYFSLGDMAVSPDHRLLAVTTDHDGDEQYELRIIDLETGATLEDRIDGLTYGLAWSADSSAVFYTLADDMQRADRVLLHRLGTDPADDVVVHHETDDRYWVGLGATRSEQYVVISSDSKTTSEARVVDATDPTSPAIVIEPRREGHEYRVEHHGDRFLILSNDDAPDFALFETPIDRPGRANWTELLPHEPGVRLDDVDAYDRHLVITRRRDNVPQVSVWMLDTEERFDLEFPETVFETGGVSNVDWMSRRYRYGYTSMVTPNSVFEIDIDTREVTLLKQQEVVGGHDPSDYVSERLMAPADDGTLVPVSVVRHRDTPVDGTAAAVVYAYGSYETIMPSGFSVARLSLLDRGLVFALAHVRGGGELGRAWYDDGKMEHKHHSFSDTVAVVDHLAATGWAHPDRMVVRGGSAGGLLVGAVLNMAPEKLAGAVAEVPFVDNVNTMLDPSLPLTITEYDEWGNPEEPDAYGWMTAYSPYENVAAIDYPPVYATAGLNDPRVSYWEPAKWIAKLRATATGRQRFVLKTEMGAGHGGPSGRYDAWRDEAGILAFVLDCVDQS